MVRFVSACDEQGRFFLVVMCIRLVWLWWRGGGGCSSLVVLWGFLSCCSRVLLSNCGGVGSSCKTYGGVSVGLGLALSCDGELSDPLELLQENQVSS